MSWYKKKKHPRLRICKVNISKNCLKVFKTSFKRAGRRTACPKCKKYLHKIGTNVEEFIKMEEPKEEIIWKNRKEATVKIEKTIPIKNEKKQTVGTKREVYTQNTTAEEIEWGIEVVKDRVNESKNQVKILTRQLEQVGKVPMKTPEMMKLQQNLMVLSKIDKAAELSGKLESFESSIKEDEIFIMKRKESLKKRPRK